MQDVRKNQIGVLLLPSSGGPPARLTGAYGVGQPGCEAYRMTPEYVAPPRMDVAKSNRKSYGFKTCPVSNMSPEYPGDTPRGSCRKAPVTPTETGPGMQLRIS